jgi:hypothetical protein
MSEPHYPPPPPPQPGQPGGAPVQPIPPGQPAQTAVKHQDYWALSIISFLCSLLIGGIGIYFSAQVGSRWNAGNVEGARKASKTALILGIVGISIGVLFIASVSSSGS